MNKVIEKATRLLRLTDAEAHAGGCCGNQATLNDVKGDQATYICTAGGKHRFVVTVRELRKKVSRKVESKKAVQVSNTGKLVIGGNEGFSASELEEY